jgi:hypothetical protein
LVAAGFVPFTLLPLGLGGSLWRAIGATVFLTGLAAWGRRACPTVPLPMLFLSSLLLSIGSLANGQANTLVAGLLLWGTILAASGRWTVAAVLIAGAALFKGYPIALGGLLALVAPVRFGLPLLAALAAGLALPFALQSPDYVTAQYQFWMENLGKDDRTGFPLYISMQDFHMLLRVAGWNLPLDRYRVVQAAAGLLAAAAVGRQLWRGVSRPQVVLDAFTIGTCWMIVFGPAVESSTFILLAPVLARELLDRAGRSIAAKAAIYASAALFTLSVGVFAFPHEIHRPVISIGVQPLAALLGSAAALGRVIGSRREHPVAIVTKVAEPAPRLAA